MPTWTGWNRRSFRTYSEGWNGYCPKCGKQVLFIKFPNGGGVYFQKLGPPWKRHPCTDNRKGYRYLNKRGIPKLRNRRSNFERDGWLPLFIKKVEQTMAGTLVYGVALVHPAEFYFGFPQSISPEKSIPISFRIKTGRKSRVEMNFFPIGEREAISVMGFDDCRTELELRAKV